MWYWRSDAGVTRLTSCFVHIQWLRMRCMADSVARRPHTATSVSGLISPPSPIPVVLPVMFLFFFSSILIRLSTIYWLYPPITFVCLPPGFHLVMCIFQPAWSLSDSPCVSRPRFSSMFPPRLFPAASILPPSLATCSSQAARSSPEHFALVLLPLIHCRCLFLGWAALLCLAWECWLLWAVRLQGQRVYTVQSWPEGKKKDEACIILHNYIQELDSHPVFFLKCQKYWQFSSVPPSSCERSLRIRSSVIKCVF